MFLVGFMVVKISINNGAFWPTFIMDPGGGKGGVGSLFYKGFLGASV